MLCVEYGQSALVEKAFTVNAAQAKVLIEKGKDNNVLVAEAIWSRYLPVWKQVADLIASGTLGEPRLIAASHCQSLMHIDRIVLPELAGGALLDLGVYPLNFAEMFFGRAKKVESSAVISNLGIDIRNTVHLTFDNGRTAVAYSAADCVCENEGRIYCENGMIRADSMINPTKIYVENDKKEIVKVIERPTQYTGYEYELLECAKAIEAGACECESMPHDETIHMMELMDEIRKQIGVVYPFEQTEVSREAAE